MDPKTACLVAFASVVALAGCGSDDSGTTAAGGGGSAGSGGSYTDIIATTDDPGVAICALQEQCNPALHDFDECIKSPQVFPGGCLAAVKEAACNDVDNAGSKMVQVCFPPCGNSGTSTCDADGNRADCFAAQGTTLTFTIDCTKLCAKNGKAFGACGTTFEGMTSKEPKCWCK